MACQPRDELLTDNSGRAEHAHIETSHCSILVACRAALRSFTGPRFAAWENGRSACAIDGRRRPG
jgi:hypothetical protein